ncbi:sugar ABC transporter permease [Clostridium sp. AF19-22AC]|uniref:Carbohydrate ABC transporter membrane protein 1 (CUT1 family) n=1 Tax=Faecalicatena orotica TaxID=1544 RepID=A0A2Y9BKS0_9FIRM|nr:MULTISPECIES: sugar ABC transporter permease [Clostridia]PWJ22936.1 carbohydrate ABC transporter membrane protein 1 (CUT1 family) [Faecalicatena orotica]RHR21217.1 sugar ABC transporter permease [Clostridium sp. AF19-22AC]SSA58072.1 carbohydrate ABC transporter membrane protein 1, CUT1 family [Faecalicatena orotica]
MKKKRDEKSGYLFILPATLMLLGVNIYPLVRGIMLAFTNRNFLYPKKTKIVGLKNFIEIIFRDKEFWGVLGFTFFFAIASVVIIYLIGLCIALLINREFKGKNFFRALFLLPWVIPSVVAANSWIWMMNDQTGFINTTLMKWGVIKEPILFLATKHAAQLSAIMVNAWKSFPFMLLVLLAAMQNIDHGLYESARIDGASRFQCFRYITMPMIKGISVVSTVLMMIWSFNNFENVYLLTRGGPARATMNISIYTYNLAFYRNQWGYASAVAVVMMIIMFALSYVYRRLLRTQDD